LRNWLLLALRMAAIALLAALFARPTVDSAAMAYWLRALLLGVLAPLAIVVFAYSLLNRKSNLLVGATGIASLLLCAGLAYFLFKGFNSGGGGNLGDASDPVATALVFDTSPRMGLRHENKSRLEQAREMARELMKSLPADSEVAIIDGANFGAFSVDLGVAATSVDALDVMDLDYPLSDLVSRGLELISNRDDKRKEIYIFSDLSAQVWQADAFKPIRDRLQQQEDISMFVLDVGVDKPRNVRLGQLALSSDSLARGQTLKLDTEVSSLNFDGEVDVEVFIEEPDPTRPVMVDGKLLVPELTTRDRKTRQLESGGSVPVSFAVKGLSPGVHHGQVKVRSNDGLAIDDVRYFTVEVRPPFPVLIASGDGADPQPVKLAISPDQYELENRSVFDCELVSTKELLGKQLAEFSIIALLDPGPMTSKHWNELENYVRDGGALIMALGWNVQENSRAPVKPFNDAAKSLLPAPLKSHWIVAPNIDVLISLRSTSHPILAPFRNTEGTIAWDESPIFRHWSLDTLQLGANVVATYSNNKPLLIESALGEGRVVMLTTPLSDNPERQKWNDLPTTKVPLPFFLLTQGTFRYLATQSEQSWNHQVGQTVSLSTENDAWQLVTPRGDWQNVRGEDSEVSITSTEQIGTYRLKPTSPTELGIGFSANLPTMATDLRRLESENQNKNIDEQLTEILGESSHTLARDTTELNRGIGRARVGRELFPFLILIVVGLLAFEHLLSNRFYSTEPTTKQSAKMKAAA